MIYPKYLHVVLTILNTIAVFLCDLRACLNYAVDTGRVMSYTCPAAALRTVFMHPCLVPEIILTYKILLTTRV